MLFLFPLRNLFVDPLRGLIIWLQRSITITKCFFLLIQTNVLFSCNVTRGVSCTNKPFWPCSTMSWMMSLSTGATWSSCLGERRTSSSIVFFWTHTHTQNTSVNDQCWVGQIVKLVLGVRTHMISTSLHQRSLPNGDVFKLIVLQSRLHVLLTFSLLNKQKKHSKNESF